MRIEIKNEDLVVTDESGMAPAIVVSFSDELNEDGLPEEIVLQQGNDTIVVFREILDDVIEAMRSR